MGRFERTFGPVSGGQAFWIILLLIAIVPLTFLLVWGFQNGSVAASTIGTILLTFTVITLALRFFRTLWDFDGNPANSTTFSQNSLAMWIGIAFGWLVVTVSKSANFNFLSLPKQEILAQIGGNIPLFWDKYINTVGAAFAEEVFFLVTIPFLLFMVLEWAGSVVEFFKNPVVQIIIVAAIVGPLFAVFHVGSLGVVAFLIAATIFRIVNIVLVHGDRMLNLVPFITLTVAFSFGLHFQNNSELLGGSLDFIRTMFYLGQNAFERFMGPVVVAFFGWTFLAALNQLRKPFVRGNVES